MKLHINTTNGSEVIIFSGNKELARVYADKSKRQADELLVLVDQVLHDAGVVKADLKLVEVENRGGSFTSLRIGVVTANALAFALGIPIQAVDGKPVPAVAPAYSSEPEIGGQLKD